VTQIGKLMIWDASVVIRNPGVSSGTPGTLSRVGEILRNQEKLQEGSRMFWRIA